MAEQHWTQILVALVTVLGVYIAYQQWNTARNKLKLDLFEKRLAVHKAVSIFINSIYLHGTVENKEIDKFIFNTNETKWLFDEDVAIYLKESVLKNADELQRLYDNHKDIPVGEERIRTKNAERQAEIRKWFRSQDKVLDEKFSPFLSMPNYSNFNLKTFRKALCNFTKRT